MVPPVVLLTPMLMVRALFVNCILLAAGLTGTELKDVEFARPDGVSLTLDAWIPDGPALQPCVILVHGGGWEAGDKRTYINPWFGTLSGARIACFISNLLSFRLSKSCITSLLCRIPTMLSKLS